MVTLSAAGNTLFGSPAIPIAREFSALCIHREGQRPHGNRVDAVTSLLQGPVALAGADAPDLNRSTILRDLEQRHRARSEIEIIRASTG